MLSKGRYTYLRPSTDLPWTPKSNATVVRTTPQTVCHSGSVKCCNWQPKDEIPRKSRTILHVSPRTVEFHRYRLMETLGLHTTAELVQYAIKHHIVF